MPRTKPSMITYIVTVNRMSISHIVGQSKSISHYFLRLDKGASSENGSSGADKGRMGCLLGCPAFRCRNSVLHG